MKKLAIVVLAGLISACGADSSKEQPSAPVTGDAAKAAFEKAFKGVKVSEVRPAPMKGMFELDVNGAETVYMSEDGQYMVVGKLLQIKDGEVVNLADQRLEKVRADGLAKLDLANTITYKAKDEKGEVFVFTDITCGYCRKLHRHIDEYNDDGITVHYLAFPRGGEDTAVADSMRHIWCAEDKQQALTEAKLNNAVSQSTIAECGELVDKQYELGQTFGVRGTPAIYTKAGKQLGGYVTPEQMLERLN